MKMDWGYESETGQVWLFNVTPFTPHLPHWQPVCVRVCECVLMLCEVLLFCVYALVCLQTHPLPGFLLTLNA